MRQELREELRSLVGNLNYDILTVAMDNTDQRIFDAVDNMHHASVYWLGNKAVVALRELAQHHPNHQTPLPTFLLPHELLWLQDIASGKENWVEVLSTQGKLGDVVRVTVACLLALKYFDEGRRPLPPAA